MSGVTKASSKLGKRLPILMGAILWWSFHTWVLNDWFGFEVTLSAWDALISVNWMMMSCALMELILTRYIPKVGKYQFVVGLSLVLSFLCYWISLQTFSYIEKDNLVYADFLAKSVPIRIGINFLIITSAGLLLVFYTRANELEESRQQQSATESMAREAELQKLQLQLQPHFLFNSLNSINALILIQPPKAREMVQQLSDFLRATLKRADEQWITLAQELAYLQLYLAIEKVRFGHRLEVRTELDDQLQLLLIPPLLLQPLVENAIKFGLYGTTEQVVIHMSTKRLGEALLVEISNPFDEDMQPAEGSGFGLNGLKRRLYLLYARNDLITTTIENNLFTVRLILPEKPLSAT